MPSYRSHTPELCHISELFIGYLDTVNSALRDHTTGPVPIASSPVTCFYVIVSSRYG